MPYFPPTSSGGMTIGDAVSSGTAGSLLFVDTNGKLGQDNSVLYYDEVNNRLGIGTTGLTTSEVRIVKTRTDAINGDAILLYEPVMAFTGTATGTTYGMFQDMSVTGNGFAIGSVFGHRVNVTMGAGTSGTQITAVNGIIQDATDSGNWNTMIGVNYTATHRGTGTVTNLRSVLAQVAQNTGAGTVTNMAALETDITISSTVTTFRGLRITAPGGTGTVTTIVGGDFANQGRATATNSFGIRVLAQSGSSSNSWGIGVEGASTNSFINGLLRIGTATAPVARLHVTEPTLGNEVYRYETTSTGSDPADQGYHNRVATTDATVTTLHTFTIPTNTAYTVTAKVLARRTGGTAGTAQDSASYILVATYKNVGGTATLVGAVARLYEAEDQAAWDCVLTISGATVLVQVTGATNNNVTWHMSGEVRQVST